MPLACERVITCRVRTFTLFPETPYLIAWFCQLSSTIMNRLNTNILISDSYWKLKLISTIIYHHEQTLCRHRMIFAFLKIWPDWVDTRKYHLKSWYFLGRHKSNTISAPQEPWDFPNMRYKETCKSFNQSLQSPGFIPLLEIPKCYLGKKNQVYFLEKMPRKTRKYQVSQLTDHIPSRFNLKQSK